MMIYTVSLSFDSYITMSSMMVESHPYPPCREHLGLKRGVVTLVLAQFSQFLRVMLPAKKEPREPNVRGIFVHIHIDNQ